MYEVFATWAKVGLERRDWIVEYLAQMLQPENPTRSLQEVPVPMPEIRVNLPW
jgi:hypothetical protein